MATSEARPYRGIAPEQRRNLRRRALLETGLDCLAEDGLSGVSVRSICSGARLTPRYFYESFDDLDALLVAVVDAVAAEVAERALAAITAAPDDLGAQVRAAVDAGYGVVARDRRKANALLVAGAGHGPLRDRRQEIVMQYAELALANLPPLGKLTATDRRRARSTALFLMGGTAELIGAVLSGSLRLSRARVVDQLTALWVGLLAPPGP
ncbi:MAG: TetR family transcriptional regulator [Pseudonocardiales bacterium]|nr:MAG: TetR family transcriptional regulator [Pseudonocardiales bacterium]